MSLTMDEIKKLDQKKYRTEFGHYLVEGEHLVLELEKAAKLQPALNATELYVTDVYANWPSSFKKHLVNAKQMAQIADTKTPQGVVAVVPILPSENKSLQTKRAVYLHEVQDPGNLGTILRSLAWFGDFRCLLSPGSVDPYNPKVVRSSMGAIFHVPMELDVEIETLAQRYKKIACLDMQGASLSAPEFKSFDCYVFGNEARGVPHAQLQAVNAQAFTIAGSGKIESLNLATAVNICVYELNR
jgi:RNA methyltransferase, TrmH family